MIGTTALKIVPYTESVGWGTQIEFDDEEILDVQLSLDRKDVIVENQRIFPRVYDSTKYSIGGFSDGDIDKRQIIVANIRHSYHRTIAKINSIFAVEHKMQVYYKMVADSTAYKICIADPSYIESYYYGRKAARVITNIRFFRCE